jgi:hypothetical protein
MSDTERHHAAKSGSVFAEARKLQLANGNDILLTRGNALIRVTATGDSQFVKRIPAARNVVRGSKIRLR